MSSSPSATRYPLSAIRSARPARLSPHLLLVVLFCVIAAWPLFKPGYFWSAHDARHDVYFIFEYNRALDSGDWLARWSPDFSWGYGYPMFLIYGPLSTFIGTMLYRFVGLGFTQSAEMVYALATLLAGLGMYGYVRSWMGRNAGLVAAVAYAFIPYRLLEVYVRASMAEYMALAWIPFILWGVRAGFEATRAQTGRGLVGTEGNSWELIGTEEGPGRRRSLLWPLLGTALAYGAIMVTSNLVALIFTPLLALYMLLLLLNRLNEEQPLRRLSKESLLPLLANAVRIAFVPALGLVLGLLISAWFWMPAMAESQFVNNEQWYGGYFNPEQHFVYPFQLFQPGWGFGISQPGPNDAAQGGLSFQLGAVPLVLAILALIGIARLRPAWRRELWFYWLWLLVAIFLMLPVSVWAWRHVGFVSFAQFPWRWLMLAVPPLAILAGSVVGQTARAPAANVEPVDGTRGWLGGLDLSTLLLAVLLVLGSYPYLQVQTPKPAPQQGPVSYAALMRFQQSSDRMTGAPKWVDLKQRPMWSDMAELYVRADDPPLGPDATRAEQEAAIARQAQAVTSKVDYKQMPQNETLAVKSLALGSDFEKLWVVVGQPDQRIVFNIAWFPGWRAYELSGENGEIIGELPVEREDGPLARIVVPVPQRTFYMLLRFEDTPVRTFGKLVSLVGWALLLAVVAVVVVLRVMTRRARSAQARS